MWRKSQAYTVVALTLLLILGWLFIQPADGPRPPVRIGTVQLGAIDLQTLEGFVQGMTELGYVEGRDVVYHRSGPAGAIERLDPIIAEQLEAGVDLFFVSSSPGTLAVKRVAEQQKIPVVFAPVNDPITAGIVDDMQHPGGQLTGVRLPPGDDLRMQWFQRAVPTIRRLYFPYKPKDPSSQESLRQAQRSSAQLGLELVLQPFERREDIPELLRSVPDTVDAMFLARDSTVDTEIEQFVAAAIRLGMPLCASSLSGVRQGALMSYGFDHREIGRQAARLADQILRGVPPGDLPVETASNYLGVNLDTADAMGFGFSPAVLREAHLRYRETAGP